MIPIRVFKDQKVAIFGLGTSGIIAAQALRQGGAQVVAWDDDVSARKSAESSNIYLENLKQSSWQDIRALILAPGVPLTHPSPHWVVRRAQQKGVEIIGDIELFFRQRAIELPHVPVIAVTGTNGKSTTTALIGHLLRTAYEDVQVGGNIGNSALALAPFAPNRIYVLECSSFQIELAPSIRPSLGVWLNLTPDHLDRHGTLENYGRVKNALIQGSDCAVVGGEDAFSQDLQQRSVFQRPTILLRSEAILEGAIERYSAQNGKILQEKGKGIICLDHISSLRGEHNAWNAAAAIAVAAHFSMPFEQIQQAIKSFCGLPHRLEQVGGYKHLIFINDSKATNALAAEKALHSFEHIFWILGGRPKAGGLSALNFNALRHKIEKAYTIGESAEDFCTFLQAHVPVINCGKLSEALECAAADAQHFQSGQAVILFSPACASYDQYGNFEQRGMHFRQLVNEWIYLRTEKYRKN